MFGECEKRACANYLFEEIGGRIGAGDKEEEIVSRNRKDTGDETKPRERKEEGEKEGPSGRQGETAAATQPITYRAWVRGPCGRDSAPGQSHSGRDYYRSYQAPRARPSPFGKVRARGTRAASPLPPPRAPERRPSSMPVRKFLSATPELIIDSFSFFFYCAL